MKYIHWIIFIGFTFFGVSCSAVGDIPISSTPASPTHPMFLPLVANEKIETRLTEVPAGDGFKTVFLFTDEGNVKETMAWAEDAIQSGKEMISFGLFAIVSIVLGVIKAKGFRKFTGLIGGGLILFFWMSWAINWVEIGQEMQKEQQQEYQALLDIYNHQQYQIAEGFVVVLRVKENIIHRGIGDIVMIDGVQLEVSGNSMEWGYKKFIEEGGVLNAGRYVRVFYTGTTLLRVDVKEE